MSIEPKPGGKPLTLPPPPSWGEFAPEGETVPAVRFALEQSVVSFPFDRFKRWEHMRGTPEVLTICTGEETIVVEGRELAAIHAALDEGRLRELRVNYPRATGARPGPQVRRIALEPA